MTEKINLYLAHPILYRHLIRDWELGFEERFPNVNLDNPFYDSGDSNEEEAVNILDSTGQSIIYTPEFSRELVERDLEAIRRNKGVIAYLGERLSIGTNMEIAYAKAVYHKPVFIIAPETTKHKEFPLANHPWIQVHSNQRFNSFKEFENFVEKGGLEDAIYKK